MAKIIPTPFWKGYGFSFKQPINKNKTAKWFAILFQLYIQENLTKTQIFLVIDKKGYQSRSHSRKGWNSNVFSALANEEYIHYNKSKRWWNITPKGRQLLEKTITEHKITIYG